MKKLVIALALSTLFLPATPALALPKCTSSQTFSINSQKSTVDGYVRTVANDTKKNNDALAKLQLANTKATELNAKIIQSQQKIADLLSKVAKNAVSSPSIARGYQSQADSEQKQLNSYQSNFKWAAKDVADATKLAASTAAALKTSSGSLAFQQKKLDEMKSKCSL